MSKRDYWLLLLLVFLMVLGRQLVGNWVPLTVLGALGAAGLVMTVRYEWLKVRITRSLDERTPDDQDARLVWLEHWQDRPEILANLGRRGPAVPLRAAREVFSHDPHHLVILRLTFAGTAALVALFAVAGITRPPADPTDWWCLVGLIAGFGLSLAYLPSQMRRYSERLEVTEAALEVVRAGGLRVVVPWDNVVEVRSSQLRSLLVVRSKEATIHVPFVLRDYGRLANLIASRLPQSVIWHAA